jgi:hypothetical protein
LGNVLLLHQSGLQITDKRKQQHLKHVLDLTSANCYDFMYLRMGKYLLYLFGKADNFKNQMP